MRLSVGTNFDNELLLRLKSTKVANVFGKLSQDIIGGGRPSFSLPDVSRQQLAEHVKIAHDSGFEFNYLLNAACLDNLEFTQKTNKEIMDLIDWLCEIKVDWVTVSLPYLLDVVKSRAPQIKISLSTFANVDTVQKAMLFESMGADEITLPEGLNRNFELLKRLRDNLKCDLQLIATNVCMAGCPHRNTHMNFQSHASQESHESKGSSLDYSMLKCTQLSVSNPVEIIKSPWIRPEDLHHYEKIGIDKFKITERMKHSDAIVSIVKAYDARRYDGDLGRLLNFRVRSDYIRPNAKLLKSLEPNQVATLLECRDLLFARKITIDNRKLDGFLESIIKNQRDCRNTLCGKECLHCDKYAKAALEFNKDYDEVLLKRYQDIFNKLASGDFFSDISFMPTWPKEIKQLFNKMIEGKPDYVKEVARISITLRAESNARERQSKKVELSDLVRANFFDTPEDFRPHLSRGLAKIGISIEEFIEKHYLPDKELV